MAKSKHDEPQDAPSVEEFVQRIGELTSDLQRTRADFENYRKRIEQEKQMARTSGEASVVLRLLPVIDTIERAVAHMPAELEGDKWAQGIAGLVKNLEKSLDSMNLERIDAVPGTPFDPELHEAIQFDEEAEGDQEVVAEELQAGYTLHGQPIRPAMVKVTRK
ncbi:MAG TPA: nucleotide exchange factor GrpE [Candidatus Bathyarchaeia archaeon]|nr:nucleotide exchange factor GrpE [Candidatus Bathyarchaeia archaeon]